MRLKTHALFPSIIDHRFSKKETPGEPGVGD